MTTMRWWLAAVLLCTGCPQDGETGAESAAPSGSAAADGSAPMASTPTGALPSASASTATSASAAPSKPPPADKWGERTKWEGSLEEQNAHMLELMRYHLGISEEQRGRLEAILTASGRAGQGNPDVAKHAASVHDCRQKLEREKVSYDSATFERICGDKYMAPLYDPDTQQAEDATACIDQFEFPNIPCVYPVTWVRANETVQLCQAVGKRLCDAHEWEGGCFGKLTPAEDNYNFTLAGRMKKPDAVKAMRAQHNIKIHEARRMAYGPKYEKGVCGTGSRKSKNCGVGWRRCGTNTFPAGFFPGCVSKLGVYDQHGNAAEHMNLPLTPDQMASSPEQHYGHTEMKGTWFVFDLIYAHKGHCRWRAPYWHGSRVMNEASHRNYHLGFRCCKSVKMQ